MYTPRLRISTFALNVDTIFKWFWSDYKLWDTGTSIWPIPNKRYAFWIPLLATFHLFYIIWILFPVVSKLSRSSHVTCLGKIQCIRMSMKQFLIVYFVSNLIKSYTNLVPLRSFGGHLSFGSLSRHLLVNVFNSNNTKKCTYFYTYYVRTNYVFSHLKTVILQVLFKKT